MWNIMPNEEQTISSNSPTKPSVKPAPDSFNTAKASVKFAPGRRSTRYACDTKVGFNKEGKSAINLRNLGKFCQIWPRAINLC